MTNKRVQRRVKKRSIKLGGRNTSISLEQEFWNDLLAMAREREGNVMSNVSAIVGHIQMNATGGNLCSEIRLYLYRRWKGIAYPVTVL